MVSSLAIAFLMGWLGDHVFVGWLGDRVFGRERIGRSRYCEGYDSAIAFWMR